MGGGVYEAVGSRPSAQSDARASSSARKLEQRVDVARPREARRRVGETRRIRVGAARQHRLDRARESGGVARRKELARGSRHDRLLEPADRGGRHRARPPRSRAPRCRCPRSRGTEARRRRRPPATGPSRARTRSRRATDPVAHGARRDATHRVPGVREDLADDRDPRAGLPDDLRRRVQEQVDALVAPDEARGRARAGPRSRERSRASSRDTARAPPPPDAPGRRIGRPGATRARRSRSASLWQTKASAAVNAPIERKRRNAPPSCSSTLWQSRTRRVGGRASREAPQHRPQRQGPERGPPRHEEGVRAGSRRRRPPSASRRTARGSPGSAPRRRLGETRVPVEAARIEPARIAPRERQPTHLDFVRQLASQERRLAGDSAAIRRRRPQDRDAPDREPRLRGRQRRSCPAAGRRRCRGDCRRSAPPPCPCRPRSSGPPRWSARPRRPRSAARSGRRPGP